MYIFEKIMMASEYGKDKIHNVKLENGDRDSVEMQPGYFCIIDGIATDSVYSAAFARATNAPYTYKNYNGFNAKAVAAPLTDKILICDPREVEHFTVNGKTYRIGNNTYGNSLPAGVMGIAREPRLHDTFKLGKSNFALVGGVETLPIVGDYVIPTAASFLASVSAVLPATGFAAVVEEIVQETTGAELGYTTYICRVVQL